MSKIGVELKIDVTKIDKALLFKGAKGTYLDATVFINIDEKDQYENNGMITQKVDKDSASKGNILGNCKVFWKEAPHPVPQAAPQQPADPSLLQQALAQEMDGFDDDIPF